MIRSDRSPRPIKHLYLPSPAGPPGPLHTLAEDDQGNIYYSDEINHSLVSLNGEGELRWHHSVKGEGPSQFGYPQGLSLGWINQDGDLLQCLAVCDSWNRRVQFFSPDGQYLSSWSRAGETPFSEVADVRFIPTAANEEALDPNPGFWLVLDRCNHRLCVLGQSGRLLFQIGRPFSPGLTERWFTTAALPQKDPVEPRTVLDHPPIDFLYYPARIVGGWEGTLCLWEPLARKLKLAIGGNLFPLSLPELDQWECVGLDRTGLIMWLKPESLLRRYDREGKQEWEGAWKGMAIPSNSRSTRLWLQDGSDILCWEWPDTDTETVRGVSLAVAFLRRSASRELEFLGGEEPAEAIHEILKNTTAFLEFSDSVIGSVREGPWTDQQAICATEHLAALKQERNPQPEGFATLLHRLSLGTAQLRWACAAGPTGTTSSDLRLARLEWWRLSEPLREAYGNLVQRADDLFCLLEGVLRAKESRPDPLDTQRFFFAQLEAEFRSRIAWIRDCCGPRHGSDACLRLPDPAAAANEPADTSLHLLHVMRRPKAQPCAPVSRLLREIDRISLSDNAKVSPARPAHLTSDTQGNIFVSLFNAHTVLRLDSAGRFRNGLGKAGTKPGELRNPTGVACDARERLWVADPGNRRLQIFSPEGDGFSALAVLSEGHALEWPGGLCPFGSDSMLVADTLRYCVYRIYVDGRCEILSNKKGTGPGEIRHPNSFCRDVTDPQGSVWLVDQKNNRLQKIDASGRFTGQLGRAGLGEGCLLSPRSAAMFPDGILVVAQEWFTELKLFSSEGAELDQFPLDYSPGGMLVHQGRLLVSQSDGDSIRIYERL